MNAATDDPPLHHNDLAVVLPAPAEGVMQATRPELDITQDLERHESTATTAVDPHITARAVKDEIGPDGSAKPLLRCGDLSDFATV